MTTLTLRHDQCSQLCANSAHEWLLTNGLGGYASGTVAQINTRRYHGWLMAALTPPTQRTLLVAKIDITAHYRGNDFPLYANEFADGSVTPRGFDYLQSFRIEDGLLIWRFGLGDAVIEQQLHMSAGENTTYLTLRVMRASQPIDFTLLPLCTYRDDHQQARGGWSLDVIDLHNGFEIRAFEGATPYRVYGSGIQFVPDPDWYWQFGHAMERARGLDEHEDLFRPGWLHVQLAPGQSTSVVLTTETKNPSEATEDEAQSASQCVARHQASVGFLPENAPDWVKQLAQACDQFVVARQQPEKEPNHANTQTIIAGYPWFTDWGRDTMIALTGLVLVPKRFEVGARILTTFADYISDGMLPNRFPDQGAVPEYNTADATLWFFEALQQYDRRSEDHALVEQLYPKLKEIIDWHQKGTCFGIRVDSTDGLLQAGETGVQLTWMDAKVGDWVVTPRAGKPVEINALWYNALRLMAAWAKRLKRRSDATKFTQMAQLVEASFPRFFNPQKAYLYDVLDIALEEGRHDDAIRPNVLFALSLTHSPLSQAWQKTVLDTCTIKLLTPYGLRTLAADEAGYTPQYNGDVSTRDAAYHQGTVWPWLLGAYTEAHWRVYGDAQRARSYLDAMAGHLSEAGMGSISEIFDAEPPFTPRGCPAQAWSVAEILRAWVDLTERMPATTQGVAHE